MPLELPSLHNTLVIGNQLDMRSIAYVFTDPVEIQLIMQFLGNYPEFVFHSRAFAD